MKYGQVDGEVDGSEWSASHCCPYASRERALGTHWIWGRVGPRANLGAVEKRKLLAFAGVYVLIPYWKYTL
jgi:hypothetical protein